MVQHNAKEGKDDGIRLIVDAFVHVFDKDKTGKISLTEVISLDFDSFSLSLTSQQLKHVMTSMGEVLDEQEEAGMLREAEIYMDQNGMVDYTEFLKGLLAV